MEAKNPPDIRGKKSGGTVAGIHHDVHALEGLIAVIQFLADLFAKMARIEPDEVIFRNGGFGEVSLELRRAAGAFEDRGDILVFHAAFFREEFQPIAIVGKMAGSDHDRAVHIRFVENRGHEHGRRGGHAAVQRPDTRGGQSLEDRHLERRGRDAGIMSDCDAQVSWRFFRLSRKEIHEARGDAVRRLRGEADLFVCDARRGHAADIAAVGKLHDGSFVRDFLVLFTHRKTPL